MAKISYNNNGPRSHACRSTPGSAKVFEVELKHPIIDCDCFDIELDAGTAFNATVAIIEDRSPYQAEEG